MGVKVMTMGDIHGRDSWVLHTHGSHEVYSKWKESVFTGISPLDMRWVGMPYREWCNKIIFVGDYVDSFDVESPFIRHNLIQIMDLKRSMPTKVVLLLGNHDVQYIVDGQQCSGYRPEAAADLRDLFTQGISEGLFQFAYQETDAQGVDTLWTHAGVTRGWWDMFTEMFNDPDYRFADIVREYPSDRVADILNLAWDMRHPALFTVDSYSGGLDKWAGPVWVRPAMLNSSPMPMNQVVGHTPQPSISTDTVNVDGVDYTHTFVDCLEHGDGQVYYAEI